MEFWNTFLAMPGKQQVYTLLLATLPGWLSIFFTFGLMASIKPLFKLEDKHAFLVGIVVAMAVGSTVVYFLQDSVNALLNFELYSTKAVAAGFIMTPIASHFGYRLTVLILYSGYQLTKALPQGNAFYWLMLPAQKMVLLAYRMLTNKDMLQKSVNEQGEVCERTRIDL